MRVLVTGGSGFVGAHLVRRLLASTEHAVVNLDALTYAGNPASLAGVAEAHPDRCRFVHGSVTDAGLVRRLLAEADGVIHLAAESHVDRSIAGGGARVFTDTNVVGTQTLLDALRDDPAGRHKPFVLASTDEVYGDLPLDAPGPGFSEGAPLNPSSPYAASKAAADLYARAWGRTFGLDTRIVRASNNFGPWQFPEKVVPRFATNLIRGEKLPLYGDGLHVRDWLHADDHAAALVAVLERGRPGEAYNAGAGNPRSNRDLCGLLLDAFGLGEDRIAWAPDRPGHDRRYAIDSAKLRSGLGWLPARSAWPAALLETVDWYRENEGWWRPLLGRV